MSIAPAEVSSQLSKDNYSAVGQQPAHLPVAAPSLRELLRAGYEKRATLSSRLFKDHKLPIQEVQFTMDEYNEVREKTKLQRTQEEAREMKTPRKDDLKTSSKFESKEKRPSPASTSSLQEVMAGINVQRQVALVDMFKNSSQLDFEAAPLSVADFKHTSSHTASDIQRILITGQTGSGKTTLSKYLAYSWAQGQLWPHYSQVFWITLREFNTAEKRELLAKYQAASFPLATLIHQHCFDKAAQQQISVEEIDALLKSRQTLLILDGFEEVAQVFSEVDESAKPVKAIVTSALTASCDLIVTSRDYGLPPCEFRFDRRLTNQGFSDEQVLSYVQRYFSSIPTPDHQLASEVQALVKANTRLWSHVHNPLILMLTCDVYRNAKESGKPLKDLSLLEIYEKVFSIFIRRYLNWQSQVLNDPKLAWSATKDQLFDELMAACPIEIDFLQTLSFLGMELGQQCFDSVVKAKALKEVRARYPKANSAYFLNALSLGLLNEFAGSQASPLDKTHEFAHLSFQEFLAALYMSERLQRHEPEAYEWLRKNKYNPSYREVLGFICAMLPPAKHSKFWEVLYEQTDVTGLGQLQLILFTLKAVNYNPQHPGMANNIALFSKIILNAVKAGRFIQTSWLQEILMRDNSIIPQLGDEFWSELAMIDNKIFVLPLLHILSSKVGDLPIKRREWLWNELEKLSRSFLSLSEILEVTTTQEMENDGDLSWFIFVDADGSLGGYQITEARKIIFQPYLEQVLRFSIQERSCFFTGMLNNLVDIEKIRVAMTAANFFIRHGSPEERIQLIEKLIAMPRFKYLNTVDALSRLFKKLSFFSQQERGRIWDVLLGSRNIAAIKIYVTHASSFSIEERHHLLTSLCRLNLFENSDSYWTRFFSENCVAPLSRQCKNLLAEEMPIMEKGSRMFCNRRDFSEDLIQSLTKSFFREGESNFFEKHATYEALRVCIAQQRFHISAIERPRWLRILLKGTLDRDPKVYKITVKLLSAMKTTYKDWLSIPYADSYNALKALLSKEFYLKDTLSIEQLLLAYFNDTKAWLGRYYSMSELWLQFVVARIAQEGASLILTEDNCQLYVPQFKQPFVISIKSTDGTLVKELTKALTEQAKQLLLPVYAVKPIVKIPDAKREQQISSNSTTKLIATLTAMRKQDKEELQHEVQDLKFQVNSHERILAEHEQRLNQAEQDLKQLVDQTQQHEALLKEQQESIGTLKQDVITLGTNLEQAVASLNTCLKHNQHQIDSQASELTKVIKQLTNIENFQKTEAERQAEFDKKLQKNQAALENSLKRIQLEIDKLKVTDKQTAKELRQLQTMQTRLTQAYEDTQNQLNQRRELMKDPKLAKFYRTMYVKLSGYFMVCTVAATGLIKIESSASLSQQVTQKLIGALGDNIPVPGVKAAATLINKMIVWHSEQRAKDRREKAGMSSPLSFSEKEIAIELTIQQIIHRYEEQIKLLTDVGVADLAECAVNRIAHGILQSEEVDGANDFPLYLVQLLHQVKLKQGKLGQKDIDTLPGVILKGKKPWTEDGIFRRTGIQSCTSFYFTEKTESSLVGSDKPICRHQKYGFRKVADEKLAQAIAHQQGFEKESSSQPLDSLQFKPLTSLPLQAPPRHLSFLGDVKQAAGAAIKDTVQGEAQAVVDHVTGKQQVAIATAKSFVSSEVGDGQKIISSLGF